MKRVFSFLVIVVLIVGGFYGVKRYRAANSKSDKNAIKTDVADTRDIEAVVNATGEVLPILSSTVKSEVSGRLTKIYVEEGDSVKKGQLLMELDRTSLLTRVLEAERSLAADQLRLEKSERNFLRLKELFGKNFVGEKDYLDAKTEFELSKLSLEIAQARLEDVEDDLSKTGILAPHDGIITLMDVVDGQVISGATSVSNGTDLMTLSQLTELYMEASINEVDVERLEKGASARLTFDAIPDFEIEGRIDVIAPSARRNGNIRVFPIEVIFESEDRRVRPGISAKLEIPIDHAESVVSILLSAVFNGTIDGEEASYAFIRNGDSWKRQVVEVGINDLQFVEIKSGLKEGDVVALSRPPAFRVTDE